MAPLQGSKTGQSLKIYHLNEQQATLFITYLQNTPPVRRFKRRLVHDFFAMREELTKRRVLREVGKPTQRELTDAIRDSGEGERMHGHAFNTYQNLIYKGSPGPQRLAGKEGAGRRQRRPRCGFSGSGRAACGDEEKRLVTDLLDEGLQYEAIRALLVREEAHT